MNQDHTTPVTEMEPTDTDTPPGVPWSFRVIAVFAVLWNLMGCAAFAMELFAQEEAMKNFTAEQQEWARSIPSWSYVVYGLAVTSGFAGSIGLLVRKNWSMPVFAVSLVAILILQGYTILIAGGLQVLGTAELVMPIFVIALAGYLLWFSRMARGRGCLTR